MKPTFVPVPVAQPATAPVATAPVAKPVAAPAPNPIPQVAPPVLTRPVPVPTAKVVPIAKAIEKIEEEVDIEILVEGADEIERSFSRKDRRRLMKGGKPKPSDESLVQRVEAALLVKLAKIYPNNADIIKERDKRVQPKKLKQSKKAGYVSK